MGGFYSATGATRILGDKDVPISKRRDVLALHTDTGQTVYPRAQFDGDGHPLPGMPEILALLPPELVSPWTLASWLVSGRVPSHVDPPLALLRAGSVDAVVAAAREWARALNR